MIGAAVFMPWRAWPRIWSQRLDAGWLFAVIGVESLLVRPELSIRAVWAIARRGVNAFMPVLRLASLQILWALALGVALALFLRFARKSSFALGELAGITPWAYAPKIAVTVVFAALWAVGIDGFAHPLYHVLSALAVAGSVAAMIRAHDHASMPPAPRLTWALGIALALVVGGYGVHAARTPDLRPVGNGDRISALDLGETRLTFPREKPVILDFWATWCPPCIDALPEWQTLHTSERATLISANVEADVSAFLDANHYTFKVYYAPAELQSRFQVTTLPTLVRISAEGEITAYQVGRTNLRSLLH